MDPDSTDLDPDSCSTMIPVHPLEIPMDPGRVRSGSRACLHCLQPWSFSFPEPIVDLVEFRIP